ncbi:MAG TPA: hypothetical protein VEP73_04865 [Actinomycetota bacterium]|nr:hypothetical protein [Actinomycetota bacterium]
MTTPPRWEAGARVVLAGASGDLARLQGTRATVLHVAGDVALVRFDSAKLLGGRLRRELEVAAAWLVDEPPVAAV